MQTLQDRYHTAKSAISPQTTIPIVFIDSIVNDSQTLINSLIPDAEVIVIEQQQDGILAITQILQERANLAAVYIVSHGSPGCVNLGNTQLSLNTLNKYARELKMWATALKGAPLMLHGCNVAAGEAGATFVEQLHLLTRMEILASAKLTDNAVLEDDWELEEAALMLEIA